MLLFLTILSSTFAAKVKVSFYGEAMCPDTTRAFGLGLNETVTALGLGEDSIMNLEIIPWGNAYYNNSFCGMHSYNKSYSMFCWAEMCGVDDPPEECWEGRILCQHGLNEGYMMMYQECALDVGGIEEGYYFYQCLTNKESMAWRNGKSGQVLLEAAAYQCTKNEEIHSCYYSNKQKSPKDNIWNRYARKTLKLGASKKGTPWILVNGIVVDYTDLLDTVCSVYEGELPPGCTEKRKKAVTFQPLSTKKVSRRRPTMYDITLIEITYHVDDHCQGEEILLYYVDAEDNCNQGFYKDREGVAFVFNSSSNQLSYNEYTENTCSAESLVKSTPLDFESCSLAGFNWNTYRLVEGPITVMESGFTLDIGYENPTCAISGWYGFSVISSQGTCVAFCSDYDNVKFSQAQRCSPFTFPGDF